MKNVNILRDLSSLSREELEQQVMRLSTQVDELSSKLSWYEEQYRLSRAQRFGPSIEQTAPFEQMSFFNEAESESSAFIIPEPALDEVKVVRKSKQKGHKGADHKAASHRNNRIPAVCRRYGLSSVRRNAA